MSKTTRQANSPVHDVLIESLSHEGRGVARIDGKTVFVDGALPGELISINYLRRKSRYDEAEVIDIASPSEHRVEANCKYYDICGGCSLQHMKSDIQISHKQDVVQEQLSHIGNVSPEIILPPVSGSEWGYRNKARLGVKKVFRNNKVLVGFREKRKPSFLADIDECLVLHPSIGLRISDLKILIGQLDISSKIPQLEVAVGGDTSAIVIRHLEYLSPEDIDKLENFSTDTGIKLFLQGGRVTSVTTLDGSSPPFLNYEIPEEKISIHFSPTDFTQINPEINLIMIKHVMRYLELDDKDNVLDLFCGLGNFTLPIARKVNHITGVEGARIQVDRAIGNARYNSISNVEFIYQDLYASEENIGLDSIRYNKLILDPPRSGAKEIIHKLNFANIEKIVYVSCNPATLARDAGILVNEKGYKFKMFGVIDMFPHTAHVESIAVFNR